MDKEKLAIFFNIRKENFKDFSTMLNVPNYGSSGPEVLFENRTIDFMSKLSS